MTAKRTTTTKASTGRAANVPEARRPELERQAAEREARKIATRIPPLVPPGTRVVLAADGVSDDVARSVVERLVARGQL